MTDQCRYCTHKGDLEACEGVECTTHDSWYVLGLKGSVERLTGALVILRGDIRASARGVELALGEAEQDNEKHPLAVDCPASDRRIGQKMVDSDGVLVRIVEDKSGACGECLYDGVACCRAIGDNGSTIGCGSRCFIFKKVKT